MTRAHKTRQRLENIGKSSIRTYYALRYGVSLNLPLHLIKFGSFDFGNKQYHVPGLNHNFFSNTRP